ncbi:MAG: carboxypeptidase M32 [Anaerolinea sp.]|nr:carboxypeptidase M32 [Anaerolinea sp.]MCC6973938.1 carboxypeptidase M32 [Anaerolineae bacterium]CAG0993102.1 carboxypeptidase Taq [Anaerolineales bacterium]
MSEPLQQLKERLADIENMRAATAILEWDQQTQMPPGAAESRARQLGTLSKLAHEMFVSDETGALLEKSAQALNGADYDSFDASLIRVTRKDYERERKLPPSFVSEMTQLTALAHEVWAKARAEDNFAAFAPTLKKIVDMKRREAELRGYTDHIYDALIDTYEPGMKTADVAQMFNGLSKELVPFVAAIRERVDQVSDKPVHQDFDEDIQRRFAEMVVSQFGYDFQRGRQDRAVHPFCTSFSCTDVRITTRYERDWLNPALFGTLHEAGHGMYEQGSALELDLHGLRGGTSLGVHESQSRLWENVVGRSRGFWTHFYPKLQAEFPAQLENISLDDFYRAVNKVEPSLIRVEADEVTYNLHIMVRFEIETDLLAGSLTVDQLPEVWNAKYHQYLGITPPNNRLGVLQDIHWSGGLMGYFPTYSIGNLLSVQLYEKAVSAHPTIPEEITQGKFETLRGWMTENVYRHGRKYDPTELIQRATGEKLTPRPYLNYLKRKYGEIYGV